MCRVVFICVCMFFVCICMLVYAPACLGPVFPSGTDLYEYPLIQTMWYDLSQACSYPILVLCSSLSASMLYC